MQKRKHRVDVHERSRHSCYTYIYKYNLNIFKYSIHPSTITKGLYIYIYLILPRIPFIGVAWGSTNLALNLPANVLKQGYLGVPGS